MSIRQNFPTTPPSLVLDFANSKTLDPRITFSRTTTATRMNELGLIETVDADVARFDHKYENGVIKSLGLLVEESRQNLLTYSEDWSAYQAKQSLDVTINDITSPDGAETADKLQCNASGLSNDGFIQKLQTVTASTKTYTTSWFVKRGNTDRTNLSTALSGGTYLAVYAYIDWTSSPVSFNYDDNNGSPVYTVHPSLDEYPNGWYRASISITNNNTNTQITNRIYASSRSSTVYGDYVYAWGSQAEEGSFPTSYIPRLDASTATRNPDSVSMTGNNFSDWYNQSEGTLYASASILGKNIHTTGVEYPNGICKISNSGENASRSRVLYFGGNADPDRVSFGNRDSSTSTTLRDDTFGDIQSNQYYRVCGTYINNDEQALCLNGESVGYNGTNVNPPTPNQLLIGSGYNGGIAGAPIQDEMYLNGHISKLTYYPTRLSNDNLQTLTK